VTREFDGAQVRAATLALREHLDDVSSVHLLSWEPGDCCVHVVLRAVAEAGEAVRCGHLYHTVTEDGVRHGATESDGWQPCAAAAAPRAVAEEGEDDGG
jgi:hypothetical protein